MTFGERLTQLRKENGYSTRNEFADRLGIPNTTLRNYETDAREPGHTFLKQISELFNVSVDYLLCLTDEKEVLNSFRLRSSEQDLIEKYRSLDSFGQETVSMTLDRELCRTKAIAEKKEQIQTQTDYIAKLETTLSGSNTLRLYTYLQKLASAGTGFYFDDIPTDAIEAPYCKGADFIIGVNGDSMEPDYHDGDKLYIQKTKELTLGDVGIFTVWNEFFVKELGERGLVSHNPAYDEIPGTEDVILIGRVLGKVEES